MKQRIVEVIAGPLLVGAQRTQQPGDQPQGGRQAPQVIGLEHGLERRPVERLRFERAAARPDGGETDAEGEDVHRRE